MILSQMTIQYFSYYINEVLQSGIVITDVADHLGIFSVIKTKKAKFLPKTYERRIFNDTNIKKFKQLLLQCNFNGILNSDCVNLALEQFERLYTESFDAAFPLKTVTQHKKNNKTRTLGHKRVYYRFKQ